MDSRTDLAWQNEDVMCDLFCVRQLDTLNPEDQGSEFPDAECYVHWAPGYEAVRLRLDRQRRDRWKARRPLPAPPSMALDVPR